MPVCSRAHHLETRLLEVLEMPLSAFDAQVFVGRSKFCV
jgi:hypothetical protein